MVYLNQFTKSGEKNIYHASYIQLDLANREPLGAEKFFPISRVSRLADNFIYCRKNPLPQISSRFPGFPDFGVPDLRGPTVLLYHMWLCNINTGTVCSGVSILYLVV